MENCYSPADLQPKNSEGLSGKIVIERRSDPPGPRHRLFVRVTHWINAICFFALLISGSEILAHHPELYWGENGFFGDPHFVSFSTEEHAYIGIGTARSIHFLAAWVLVFNASAYVLTGLIAGHIWRNLLPDRDQLTIAHVRKEITDHLRMHHDEAELARRYNLVQKLAYLGVLFICGPLIVLTGLAMSPAVTAQYPWLIEMFAGRQTARTLHFITAAALIAFVSVHVWQVWLVGFRRAVAAMITGRFRSHGGMGQQ